MPCRTTPNTSSAGFFTLKLVPSGMNFQVEVGGSGQPLGATLLARKLGEAAQTLTTTSGVFVTSVFCENKGKNVTIVVPRRVAIESEVKVVQCRKTQRNADCNSCLAKYACAVFLGQPRFSGKAFTERMLKRKQR